MRSPRLVIDLRFQVFLPILLVAPTVTQAADLLVSGADATETLSTDATVNYVFVGENNGETGTLTIAPGTTLTSNTAGYIGRLQGSTGSVLLSGTGSTWNANTNFTLVGYLGSGTLTLANGATMNALGLNVAYGDHSRGTVSLSGTGTKLTTTQGITMGYGSTDAYGELTIRDGASLETQGPDAGVYLKSGSVVTVTGGGTSMKVGTLHSGTPATWLDADGWLSIGHGTMTVSDGAHLETDGTYLSGDGTTGGVGTMTVTGAGTVLNSHLVLYVGGNTHDDNGNANLIISDGATASASVITTGEDPGSTGTILLTGRGTSLSSVADQFAGNTYVGSNGTGIITLQEGASLSVANELRIGYNATASGTLNIGAAAGETAVAPGSLSVSNGIVFGSGTGSIVFNHTSDDFTLDSVLSGSGAIRNIAGTTNLTGSSAGFTGTIAVEGGALRANGDLSGATTTVSGGATLGGTGSVGALTVNSGGVHAPGNSVGTQTVNGLYTLGGGSALNLEVSDDGTMDRVIATGGVTLTGANLSIATLGGTYGADSYSQTIIDNQSANAVTGTFGSVSESLVFYDATVTYDGGSGNDVVLSLDRNSTALSDVATTPNQKAVAGSLGELPRGSELMNNVLSLTSTGAQSAYTQLSGNIYPSTGQVNTNVNRQIGTQVSGRLNTLRAGRAGNVTAGLSLSAAQLVGFTETATTSDTPLGLNLGTVTDGMDGLGDSRYRNGAWSQAVFGSGTIDASENAVETDYAWAGMIGGYDIALNDNLTFGTFFGYVDGDNEQSDIASSVDTTTVIAGLYGEYHVDDWRANARLSWSRIYADSTRRLSIGGFSRTAKTDYVDNTVSLEGELARTFALKGNLWVEPYAGAAARQTFLGAFSETGADTANLARDADWELVGNTELGLRMASEFEVGGVMVMPQFGASWKRHIGSRDNSSTLHFATGGADFVVHGTPENRNTWTGNLGGAAVFDKGLSAFASYNPSFSTSQIEHSFIIGGRIEW